MRIKESHWLFNRPIAHRGLWGESVVENSITAYKNAINNGFPIEIDLRTSSDGEIYSFHDQTLNRMTGADGNIYDKTSLELEKIKLIGSEETIPTFKSVLDLVDGKTPLLIEFKDQPDNSYVKKAVEMLKNYKGAFAVQSFNPLIIKEIKKLAPQFIRGILGSKIYSKKLPFIKRIVVKNMLLNCIIKPDFISYSYKDLPLKMSKTKNTPVIAWTVKNQETADKIKPYAKNIIFENFIPVK